MAPVATHLALALALGLSSAPSPAEIERARELYDNGRTLYEEGSWDGAILAFEASFELSGDINLLYNISLAYDRKGDYEKAIEYLDRYRAMAPEGERAKLEHRREVLEARLQKKKDEQTATQETKRDPPSKPPPKPPPDTPQDKPVDDRLFGPAAWTLTAVGIAGYAVGIGFGASSLSRTNAAQDQCADGNGPVLCMDAARDDVRRSKNHAIGADVGFAIGAAATVAVIVIVAVKASRRKKARAAKAQARAIPGGVRVRF